MSEDGESLFFELRHYHDRALALLGKDPFVTAWIKTRNDLRDLATDFIQKGADPGYALTKMVGAVGMQAPFDDREAVYTFRIHPAGDVAYDRLDVRYGPVEAEGRLIVVYGNKGFTQVAYWQQPNETACIDQRADYAIDPDEPDTNDSRD